MTPATKIPVSLALAEIEMLLSMMLKQTALPGEAWLNAFISLRGQRDEAVKSLAAGSGATTIPRETISGGGLAEKPAIAPLEGRKRQTKGG